MAEVDEDAPSRPQPPAAWYTCGITSCDQLRERARRSRPRRAAADDDEVERTLVDQLRLRARAPRRAGGRASASVRRRRASRAGTRAPPRPGCGRNSPARLRPEPARRPSIVLPSASVTVRACRVDRHDLGLRTSTFSCSCEDPCEVEGDVAGGQLRGRHLVQQRLELVVAVLVDQGDADAVLAGEPLGARDPGESAADDDDMGAAVFAHRGLKGSSTRLARASPGGGDSFDRDAQVIRFA